jgi:hypothetical protein
MGYTTDFTGKLEFRKPLTAVEVAYIQKFNETRRMKRSALLADALADPLRKAVGLPIGVEGCYFVNGNGNYGQDKDVSVIEHNTPPEGQPGLWCGWTVNDAGTHLEWDGAEKFYNYIEWLRYLIDNFFKPWVCYLNGEITWQGEDDTDKGKIIVTDNEIEVREGTVKVEYAGEFNLRTALENVLQKQAESEGCDEDSAFRDMLTDMIHIANKRGWNFNERLKGALAVASEE